ncbi:MAG: M14 family zinc carboxypeptidase [Flavobacteriales bacterium]
MVLSCKYWRSEFLGLMFIVGVISPVFAQQSDLTGDPMVLLGNNATPTWSEAISAFEQLADSNHSTCLIEIGKSDVGRPIHAFVFSPEASAIRDVPSLDSVFGAHPDRLRLLVNNAIHPGEPCGVDASIAWMREVLGNKNRNMAYLDAMDVVIIPMYNVGGALNRNCCSRTNQDGPESYGFRGNSRNLDLNRDFIKMDSRNAQAFVGLYHAMDPDVFIDTHTTNGADYPYRMTLITTQPDKAGPILGPFLRNRLEPELMKRMADRGEQMSPYVNTRKEIPENGIVAFLETPRYSTGYTTLFGTLGFTAEAHMLKPFPERVEATRLLLHELAELCMDWSRDILDVRSQERSRLADVSELPVRWSLNDQDSVPLHFKGFESRREWSPVTKGVRLLYDASIPWEDSIAFFNSYEATHITTLPAYYYIPQAWREVIDRLHWNGVLMERIPRDTIISARVQYIEGFNSARKPYEGHHVNQVDSIAERVEDIRLFAGDYVLSTHQNKIRILAETLDPWAHDSYFTWNFFDSALQQKEYFSSYVFEETAAQLLEEDPAMKAAFEREKEQFPERMRDERSQLNWIYRQSKHFEGSVNRYPVFKSIEYRNDPH